MVAPGTPTILWVDIRDIYIYGIRYISFFQLYVTKPQAGLIPVDELNCIGLVNTCNMYPIGICCWELLNQWWKNPWSLRISYLDKVLGRNMACACMCIHLSVQTWCYQSSNWGVVPRSEDWWMDLTVRMNTFPCTKTTLTNINTHQ